MYKGPACCTVCLMVNSFLGTSAVTLVVYHNNTVYFGYSGHVYSGHSDIVATFPGTKYIYSIIFRSDLVANWI